MLPSPRGGGVEELGQVQRKGHLCRCLVLLCFARWDWKQLSLLSFGVWKRLLCFCVCPTFSRLIVA